MKKSLFLLVSLLAISSLAVFAGCNDKGNGDDANIPESRTRMITVDETENEETTDENPEDTCPDCNKRMPKVKFGHRNGRPTSLQGDENKEQNTEAKNHGGRHARHAHRAPRHPRPAPPEDNIEN